jgi:hypothetical protein
MISQLTGVVGQLVSGARLVVPLQVTSVTRMTRCARLSREANT